MGKKNNQKYKEQNMKFENSINVKLDELTNSLCSIDERINEIPVSYTHLDVYKRQHIHPSLLLSATFLTANYKIKLFEICCVIISKMVK